MVANEVTKVVARSQVLEALQSHCVLCASAEDLLGASFEKDSEAVLKLSGTQCYGSGRICFIFVASRLRIREPLERSTGNTGTSGRSPSSGFGAGRWPSLNARP